MPTPEWASPSPFPEVTPPGLTLYPTPGRVLVVRETERRARKMQKLTNSTTGEEYWRYSILDLSGTEEGPWITWDQEEANEIGRFDNFRDANDLMWEWNFS
jgi:hypothetical protein